MSNYAMPFLVFNLGGEMMYILEQRLKAQNIAADKSAKVILDVAASMLKEDFVKELIKPQDLYSNSSVREIFDRLAHSSIMRLSSASMDKLYDLMVMGLKHQLLSVSSPTELFQITMNHLDNIDSMAATASPSATFVKNAIALFLKFTSSLTMYDYCLARQRILTFLQDRLIKVSLFLQYGFQNKQDGTFVLNIDTTRIAPEFEAPGTVQYFNESGTPISTGLLPHPFNSVKPNTQLQFSNPSVRCSTLGTNIYANPQPVVSAPAPPVAQENHQQQLEDLKEPSPKQNTVPSIPAPSHDEKTIAPVNNHQQAHSQPNSVQPTTPPRAKVAVHEFNFLAKMIGVKEQVNNTFKFNLALDMDTTDVQQVEEKTSETQKNIVVINASSVQKSSDLVDIMKSFSLADSNKSSADKSGEQGAFDGDDLLDLMDAAMK